VAAGGGAHTASGRTLSAWKPAPLDLAEVQATEEFTERGGQMQLLGELLARNTHRFWCKQRRFLGWRCVRVRVRALLLRVTRAHTSRPRLVSIYNRRP
jgi:hypothetical protein